ncbi:MAG: methyltransferase [Micromonosporaceae bacterium]|nr:methyltransferase [Micromonosporaceae bacterium]
MTEGVHVTSPDPGSFRDPTNQVFHVAGEVRRGLRGAAVDDWQALAATGFFGRLVEAGKICATEPVQRGEPGWELTLRHAKIPFVSYPYEWTFSMLRDAALLHLEVLAAALAERMTTKDGSAYNLQWRGTAPVFIDVGSFERVREGEPWAGYRQFCQTLLYPLLLTAHLGVAFQPWLRSQIDGIESGQLRRLLHGRAMWKAGVLKHVRLQDAMQARLAATSARQMSAELKSAGFSTELVVATVRGLAKLVRRLDWQPPASHWEGYRETCSYSDADREAKLAFVDAALSGAGQQDLVLDLGTNDGAYARVAARHARQVVAVESDHAVTDALYRRLRDEGERRVLPLVMDLADPSPGGGWRSIERAPFVGRARAGTVLALALVHHLAIGRNVPLPQVVDLLAALGRGVVVEFVDPADPMARRLLANKPAGLFGDYHRDGFERVLAERFTIVRRQELPSGTRTLYAGVPRD